MRNQAMLDIGSSVNFTFVRANGERLEWSGITSVHAADGVYELLGDRSRGVTVGNLRQ